MSKLPRTAVILVHGIGEQKPLQTLFSFLGTGMDVPGVLEGQDQNSWFVDPDPVSDKTYLRRVSIYLRDRQAKVHKHINNGNQALAEEKKWQRITDVYEYYWAFQFRDTKLRHVLSWIKGLLNTSQADVTSLVLKGPAVNRIRDKRIAASCWLAMLALAVLLKFDPMHVYADQDEVSNKVALSIVGVCLTFMALTVGYVLSISALGLITVARSMVALIVLATTIAIVWTSPPLNLGDWHTWIGIVTVVALAGGLLCRLFQRPLRGWRLTQKAKLREWWLKQRAKLPANPEILTRWRNKQRAKATRWWLKHRTVRTRFGLGVLVILTLYGLVYAWETFDTSATLLAAAVPVIASLGAVLTGRAVLSGVGDAARYLSEDPDDATDREDVRKGLVGLLSELHAATDPETGRPAYDRVVLIGHSLGSVIAYDALNVYWSQVYSDFVLPPQPPDPPNESNGSDPETASTIVPPTPNSNSNSNSGKNHDRANVIKAVEELLDKIQDEVDLGADTWDEGIPVRDKLPGLRPAAFGVLP